MEDETLVTRKNYVLNPDDFADYLYQQSSEMQQKSEELLKKGLDLLADMKKTAAKLEPDYRR